MFIFSLYLIFVNPFCVCVRRDISSLNKEIFDDDDDDDDDDDADEDGDDEDVGGGGFEEGGRDAIDDEEVDDETDADDTGCLSLSGYNIVLLIIIKFFFI